MFTFFFFLSVYVRQRPVSPHITGRHNIYALLHYFFREFFFVLFCFVSKPSVNLVWVLAPGSSVLYYLVNTQMFHLFYSVPHRTHPVTMETILVTQLCPLAQCLPHRATMVTVATRVWLTHTKIVTQTTSCCFKQLSSSSSRQKISSECNIYVIRVEFLQFLSRFIEYSPKYDGVVISYIILYQRNVFFIQSNNVLWSERVFVSLSLWGISTCKIRPSITNQFTAAVSTHTDPQGTAVCSGLLLHVAYVTKLPPKLHSQPHVASFPKQYCFPGLSVSTLLPSL